jgi:hypothetical protein
MKMSDGIYGDSFSLHLNLPFSWSLAFFASVFYLIGYLLSTSQCPEVILRYRHFADFHRAAQDGVVEVNVYGDTKSYWQICETSKPAVRYIVAAFYFCCLFSIMTVCLQLILYVVSSTTS